MLSFIPFEFQINGILERSVFSIRNVKFIAGYRQNQGDEKPATSGTSGLFRALKMLVLREFIRLRSQIKATNKKVLLSARG